MVADCTGADLVTMKAPRRITMGSAMTRANNLKRLISGYVHTGGDPGRLCSLADVVALDTVKQGLRFHLERSGGTPTVHHAAMVIAVCTVARQWIGVPEAHLKELYRLKRQLQPKDRGMSEETRRLLRRFDDPDLLARLFSRPAATIRAIAGKGRITRGDAARAAAALGVLLLLECPVRPRNMASVDFDSHVMRTSGKRGDRVELCFGAEEVKNDEPLMVPLRAETIELLDLYVERIRPLLTGTDNSYLFPSREGGHIGAGYFSSRIAGFMQKEIGVRLTGHKFRHLAGYLYLKRKPGQHEVVRQLLGHRDIATTVRFYAPLEQDEAFAHWDGVVAELREAVNAKSKRGKGRR